MIITLLETNFWYLKYPLAVNGQGPSDYLLCIKKKKNHDNNSISFNNKLPCNERQPEAQHKLGDWVKLYECITNNCII